MNAFSLLPPFLLRPMPPPSPETPPLVFPTQALSRLSLSLLGCLLSLAVIPVGWAYQLQTTSAGKTCRWFDASLPLPWHLNMNGFTRVSATDAEATFKTAMQQWTTPSCTRWQATYQGPTTTKKSNDGKVVLLFDYPPGAGFSTLAITYTTMTPSTGEYNDGDIIFHHSRPWSANPTSQENDLRATATHEIGHLLGLGHSSDPNSTMYSTVAIGPSQKRFLGQDDIQGLCTLYPATTSTSQGSLGSLCGTSASGASCKTGLLCVSSGTGKPSYCHELCQQGACPAGGKCLQTSQGSMYCGCDSSADCSASGVCVGRICRGGTTGCTKDADCAAGQVCSQGGCVLPLPPECTKDSDCAAGLRCIDAACVQCKTDADCPQGRFCSSSACVICRTDADCTATQICAQALCTDKPTGPQPGGRGSLCGSSGGGASCDASLVCVSASGQPAYCMEYCQNGACPLGGNCYRTTVGTRFCACDADAECPAAHVCIQRNCFPKKPTCGKDADCPAHQRCNQGLCEDRPGKGFGEICTTDAECLSVLCLSDAVSAKRYCSKPCAVGVPSACPSGYVCRSLGASGACFVSPNPGCIQDTDCPTGAICLQAQCVPKPSEPRPERPAEPRLETNAEPPPERPVERPSEITQDSEAPLPTEAVAEAPSEVASEARISDTKGGSDASESDPRFRPSGCGCAATAEGSLTLFCLLLLVLLSLRRARH